MKPFYDPDDRPINPQDPEWYENQELDLPRVTEPSANVSSQTYKQIKIMKIFNQLHSNSATFLQVIQQPEVQKFIN